MDEKQKQLDQMAEKERKEREKMEAHEEAMKSKDIEYSKPKK